jgi:hypothetical protein
VGGEILCLVSLASFGVVRKTHNKTQTELDIQFHDPPSPVKLVEIAYG